MKLKHLLLIFAIAILAFFSYLLLIKTGVEIKNLRVEYTKEPLGIDVTTPRFSWQMKTPGNKKGYSQSAYHLIVTGPEGETVWDSKKIEDDRSLNIIYNGKALQPKTRYTWTVKIWDQKGKSSTNSSWFETGLMNPDPKLTAWNGATWIGGSEKDLVLYSPYLSVYKFNYSLQLDESSGSIKAGFIFGANDSRLMDKNKNIFNIESQKDSSFIKFEIDISPIIQTENGLAKLNIYRVGYHPEDNESIPFKSFNIPRSLINNGNKYEAHTIYSEAVFGLFTVFINGTEANNLIIDSKDPRTGKYNINLNPVGRGNNVISFPMLAEIGFSLDPNQAATFSNLEIRNYRNPSNVLLSENLTNPESYKGIFSSSMDHGNNKMTVTKKGYYVQGGSVGTTIVADPSQNSMPMLRSVFISENKKIKKARLYITSRGIYETYLNGKRVGDDYFNPGLTQYNKTHMYQTYDVTKDIRTGNNAIGIMLGEGWWSGNITYSGENWNYFGDRQSVLAKLEISYDDGTRKTVITTPDTWKYFNDGPVIYSSFFQGEVYDARKEMAVQNWSFAQFDDNYWENAVEVPLKGTTCEDETFGKSMGFAPISNYDNMSLVGMIGENAEIVKELIAISMEEVRPGVFVYDMGQNMVGIPQITINNAKPGNLVTLRFAEVKYPDLPESGDNVGMIMLENIRAALAQDIYILKGGKEIIQPHFTFHGYRFLEITGIDDPLPLNAVKGLVISSVKSLASNYVTSNPKVNKLWENITWSTYGNFLSIPTDCPQRNERMGWSGDISVFARTATYLTDASQFLNRHMINMRDVQRHDGRFTDVAPLGGGFGGILWGSAGITVAWESFQQYGDSRMLYEHYEAMKKYIDYLGTRIDQQSGIMNEGPLGDWLSPEGNKNDNTLIWEAYYLYDLELMKKIAKTLGNHQDALLYSNIFEKRRAFFNEKYVHPENHKTIKSGFITERRPAIGDSDDPDAMDAGRVIDTQISYAVPLAFGIFNSVNKIQAAKHLATTIKRKNRDDFANTLPEYSLMTGFIGTAWLNKALSDNNYNDIAYRLLQQTSYPSWLYPVDQGATTIWERLNSYTVENGFGGNNGMNSFNHYAFGAVGAWMYNYSLGITRDENEPGFKHFILQPTPDPTKEMKWAKGHYDSMYGRIESEWQYDDNKLQYLFTIPPNTTATLYLPSNSENNVSVDDKTANKIKGVEFLEYNNGKAIYKLRSGKYKFTTIL